jgi:hypothetical protein
MGVRVKMMKKVVMARLLILLGWSLSNPVQGWYEFEGGLMHYTYRNPCYYYKSGSVWSEFDTAISAWNNLSPCDPGDFALTNDHENFDFQVYPLNNSTSEYWAYTFGGSDGTYWVYCNVWLNTYYSLTSDQKRCVCIHELGHVWGLDDYPASPPSSTHAIMNAAEVAAHSYSWTTPQTDDKTGVNALY